MKTRSVVTAAAISCLCLLGGCVTVGATKSPNANLAQYRTFAWMPTTEAYPKQLAFERSPAGQVVKNQIGNDLAAKGLSEVAANPDFLIAYHTKLEQKTDVTDWGYGGFYWGGPVSVDQYTQGTLFIDFIDPKTKEVIWRGTATAIVDNPDMPNTHKLAGAVDKVMKRYPSEMASAGSRPTM